MDSRTSMMFCTLFFTLLALIFPTSTHGYTINKILGVSQSLEHNASTIAAAKARVETNGCKANICFAIEGSQAIGEQLFEAEKEFIEALLTVTLPSDLPSAYAATQFGLINRDISKLTTDRSQFLSKVQAATFQNATVSFMAAGLGFCVNQLDDPELANDYNKIILLGNGTVDFGDLDGPLSPAGIIDNFLSGAPNRAVSGVVLSSSIIDRDKLAEVLGIPNSSVFIFTILTFFALAEVVTDAVTAICG